MNLISFWGQTKGHIFLRMLMSKNNTYNLIEFQIRLNLYIFYSILCVGILHIVKDFAIKHIWRTLDILYV